MTDTFGNIWRNTKSVVLQVAGCFNEQVTICGTDISLQDVTFYVKEENRQPFFGKDTTSKLGIWHTEKVRNSESGIVQQITDTKAKFKAKYRECFEGLGKLKDFQLKIAIDENLRKTCRAAIKENTLSSSRQRWTEVTGSIESYDIFEENVEEPSKW